MGEKLIKTLRDSKRARWTALGIVAFTMLCGYYLNDDLSSLKPMLESDLNWSSSNYGFYRSSYGWLNVFAFMLILGGIILDKLGVRKTGILATITMLVGTVIRYRALTSADLMDQSWNIFGADLNAQVFMASVGFSIFCVGLEVAGITVSKIIVKWFKGKELALAMGLEMATARLGTGLAMLAAPIIAYSNNVTSPVFWGMLLMVAGTAAFFYYTFLDKKLDTSLKATGEQVEVTSEEDKFKLSDIGLIIKNKGFWLIAILCVLFYSAVFPFLNYAADLMVNKFGVSPKFAGAIPSLLPFGTIILTPFFGNLYDRKGKGASIMIIGSLLLIFVHVLFSIPALNNQVIAAILVILLGIAFSLVPSAMWPSVPKIIPEKQLGTAYALIFWVQNIGLMFIPLIIGHILDKYSVVGKTVIDGKTVTQYDYTLPMIAFAVLGVLALVFAFWLKAEDKRKGYGLESPNIVKGD
ncbi:MAG TPA: oxalate:formate antiporter [Porphyromonadaceae bacterium]|jgi:MFS family permease|uniref:MFS transporter n=1 Tax=Limibacterium fermenti TaxID=3229863 RepID=UPI000E805C37|nr:oxalate:formate antiporter [Porphyromonadaceae bacterium]HBK32742.1 oxalate:formate antiporter [Porphyromonadaceae bacterium]HBL34449.1 oxalate:formate antiporter [Porphyromonadaceae bacterium]HBX46145.1 oxalate:formate antiporter [Porphyromonadaceae bacterium]HCM21371.1 oxalate:formate antiporter [Porphyromonadaceae bacterium]